MKIHTGIGLVFIFVLCLSIPAAAEDVLISAPDGAGPMIGMANPAAVWAEEMGYEYVIRTDEEGNQYGVCILPDGSEVDAWQLYREAHPPEDQPGIEIRSPAEIAAAGLGHEGFSLQSDGLNQYRTGNSLRSRLNLFLGSDTGAEPVQGQSRIMQELQIRSRLSGA